MNKRYTAPTTEVILFPISDFISTSLNSDQPHEPDPGWPA